MIGILDFPNVSQWYCCLVSAVQAQIVLLTPMLALLLMRAILEWLGDLL